MDMRQVYDQRELTMYKNTYLSNTHKEVLSLMQNADDQSP